MISPTPSTPTTAPTRTPSASSATARASGLASWPPIPSPAAATVRVNTTTGVAMPSLRPLSTLMTRRHRCGTRRSLITGALSAASVGARAAPTKPASAHVRSSRSTAAPTAPSTIESGSPIPSSRAGKARSCRSRATLTCAASENRSRASVVSTRRCIRGTSTSTASTPHPGLARTYPQARNTSAVGTLKRSRRCETTAHASTRSIRTAKPTSSMPVLHARPPRRVVPLAPWFSRSPLTSPMPDDDSRSSTRPSMTWSGPVRTRVEEATRAGR